MDNENHIQGFVDEFCKKVWDQLKDVGVKGVGISGSFARGDYSKARPDVNFVIFLAQETPALVLQIGNIASGLNETYSEFFNLRPEYHPERFVFPWGRDKSKSDLFFKIALFQLKDKDLPMPFGRPGYVVEGHKLSIKMWFGDNFFKDVTVSSSNEEVIKGCNFLLPQWIRAIRLAPLSYNLAKDNDLFFNESLVWGKLSIQQYAWIQGIKNGLDYSKESDRAQIFDKIHHKEKLKDFMKLPDKEQRMVNLILEGRLHYNDWKEDKEKAEEIYLSSTHLMDYFLDQAKATLLK